MTVTPSAQRPHAGVEETRAKIIAAARCIFERKGTRGTTTREVADRAGVNEATLFRHFGSKRALLDAMREASSGSDELRSMLQTLDPEDLRGSLIRISYRAAEVMVAKRAMICVSLAEEAVGTDDEPEWRGPTSLMDNLARFFRLQIEAGRVRGDELLLARCFLGMTFSYVVARKLWDSHDVIDHAVLDGMVDIFINGVRA
jgi:AcrR family transcriptional regulator